MTEDSDSISEEERSLFRPFTRESLVAIEARIAEEHAKQKELERKRAEGEVVIFSLLDLRLILVPYTCLHEARFSNYIFVYNVNNCCWLLYANRSNKIQIDCRSKL